MPCVYNLPSLRSQCEYTPGCELRGLGEHNGRRIWPALGVFDLWRRRRYATRILDGTSRSQVVWRQENLCGQPPLFQGNSTQRYVHCVASLSLLSSLTNVQFADFSVFPLVDEDCSKRGGKPHIIDTGSWLAKYGNIYEAYSENDNHQPERLPKHVLDHAMSGADNYTRLSADKLRDWTLVVDEGVGGKTNFSCTIKMSA